MTEAIKTEAVAVPQTPFAEADAADRRQALGALEEDLRDRIVAAQQAYHAGDADNGAIDRFRRQLRAVQEVRGLLDTGPDPAFRQGAVVLSGPDAKELLRALQDRPVFGAIQEQQHRRIEGALLTAIDVAEQD